MLDGVFPRRPLVGLLSLDEIKPFAEAASPDLRLPGGGARGTRQKRKAAITVHELPKSAEEPSLLAMERETKKGSHGLENSAGARAPSRREKVFPLEGSSFFSARH